MDWFLYNRDLRQERVNCFYYFRKKLGPKHAYESHSLVPLVYVNNGHTYANGNAL